MPDPVTEQFLSASKTTELLAGKAAVDHVHEDTGGGGGGGGPSSLVLLSPGHCTQYPMSVGGVSGAGRRAVFGSYVENILYGSSIGVTDYIGQSQLSFANPGWYQMTFKIWAGFSAGTTALPEFLMLSWNCWDGADFDHEIQCTPGVNLSRSFPGATMSVMTPVFHHPGAEEASAADGAIQADLRWVGDSQLENGNGAATGSDPGQYAFRILVAKLG